MMNNEPFSFEQYKQNLVATKASDINDVEDFISAFKHISKSLVEVDSSEKQSILKLDTTTIWFTRALQLLKIQPDFKAQFLRCASADQLLTIFNYICQVYEAGSGPFTNATFGLLSKLLQFTNKTCDRNTLSYLVVQFSDSVMSIPATQKSFYILSESLIKEIDGAVSALASERFSFPEKCLEVMWSSALANSASKAFACFYIHSQDPKSDTLNYINSWSPLVKTFLERTGDRSNVIQHLLPKLFRPCPNSFLDWVKSLNITKGSESWRMLMLPLLNCAYTISTTNDPIASETLSEAELWEFLKHSDEFCRRESFALACSAVSATKVPPQYATDIISNPLILGIFFKESITPESRSDFYSLLRKALLNCRDFIITQEKRLTKKPDVQHQETVQTLKSRLQEIRDFVVSQLIPDSSYTQLVLSSDFLRFFIEYEFDGIERGIKRDVKARSKIMEIYTYELTSNLLRFVSNNYEDVRLQCSYILKYCPLEMFEQIYCPDMMENTLGLLSSLKGRQSDGGAQVIKSVSQIYMMHGKFDQFFGCLHMILSSMNSGIKADLSVHGHFTAIGEILSLISPHFYGKYESQLNPIITSLLYTSFQMWEIIKPQMTLAPSQVEEESDSEAWRSVKENSFLLKVILNLNAANKWNVFSTQVFLSVCNLLMDQLSNISHRGAFSAIYPTFVQACQLCYGTDLDKKPLEWLEANLKLLETKEQLISRRSAGLPFLLIAILNSSSSNQTRIQSFIELTFSELFRVAQIEYVLADDEKNDLPQVHAFNCMRYIFRESSLSHFVSNHLEKALEVSLIFLDHPAWAIKNGAVMLFTALQERLFGSHKLGEITTSRNASSFFSKYTGIKKSLLNKLKDSENFNDIFLVLSILSRLQTFSESDNTLQPFVDLIFEKILGHKVWKIREMAAKSLFMMTHIHEYSRIMQRLVKLEGFSKNEVHGRLMCLLEFYKSATKLHLDISQSIRSMEKWFVTTSNESDWVNLRAGLLIFRVNKMPVEVIEIVKSQVQRIISDQRSPINGPKRLFLESAITVILNSSEDFAETEDLSKSYITAIHYEAQLATVEYWMANPEPFDKAGKLLALIIDVINNEQTWNHVKAKCLKLLVDTGVTLPKALEPQENWTDSMVCLSLVLQARSKQADEKNICDFASKFSNDALPEESRLLSVLASKCLLSNFPKNESVAAQISFLLYEKLSDDSIDVRSLSCIDNTCSVVSKDIVLDNLTSKLPQESFMILLSAVENSIAANVRNLQSETQNVHFEIERTNLFRNEVDLNFHLTEKLVKLIQEHPEFENFAEEVAWNSISIVWEAAKEYEVLISSWTFNVHLDSAIKEGRTA
ncbi:hypothetical protein JCM33374_g5656 [Metschnikowia sp. JCM 33374]|nr:hypothetical protein JCM33374_g5656 [Metschnikowia sp. JCM 33374]